MLRRAVACWDCQPDLRLTTPDALREPPPVPTQSPQRRLPAGALVPGGARVGGGRIWIPWLLAPLFALAPIAGCALAGKVRQSALNFPASGPGEALTAPTVTFAQPEAPASPGGTTPVVPVVPVGN